MNFQRVVSTGPKKVRLTVKGSAAVDPESELEDSHHVLEERGVVWNAVLGMVDIVKGTNSYYKLQLLEGDSGRGYYVFRSWGRVGTTIGGTKLEVRAQLPTVFTQHTIIILWSPVSWDVKRKCQTRV